jgi:ABC-type antimicrobial peptide transport system permease subunit
VDIPLVAGRWFGSGDGVASCVLDESVARILFPGRGPEGIVGKTVTWGGPPAVEARVTGVLADPMTYRALFDAFDEGRASRALSTMLLSFRNVYVPSEAIPGTQWSFVSVVLPDRRRVDAATERLSKIWPQVDAADPAKTVATGLSVLRRRDWMEAMGGLTQMGAFLGNAVWMLIVLVACVMISTLNLITIRERYDEIAVRRCEGARKRHLVLQIAGENVATSVVGGLLGLPLGWIGAAAMREIVQFPFRFETRYAFVAMGVALLLGLLSSWIPARRAAGLDPARVLSRRLT